MSASNFISCDSVSRAFRTTSGESVQALGEVNLTVKENEFLCLLGASGCGKTTLLNLIAGFILPTTGQIKIDGNLITGPGPDRGVVFQSYSLFAWLTIQKNIEFGLRMAGQSANARRETAHHYLTLVGLEQFADKYPFELSGGMMQRVAIARSLAINPKVLLMDEPFGALDAMTRNSLQSEILDIHRIEKKTIIFVTHNIDEAIFLADRIVVMSPHPGQIRETINVDLPYPRKRTTGAFSELYEHIENTISAHVVE